MDYILGAPGSGKTAVAGLLRTMDHGSIVIDWDDLMEVVGLLSGGPIRNNEAIWEDYTALMKSVVNMLAPNPVLLLTVCTPDQLSGWPAGNWLLLDCNDGERTKRLKARGESAAAIQSAILDAADYRALGMEHVDTSDLTPEDVADRIASLIRSRERKSSPRMTIG